MKRFLTKPPKKRVLVLVGLVFLAGCMTSAAFLIKGPNLFSERFKVASEITESMCFIGWLDEGRFLFTTDDDRVLKIYSVKAKRIVKSVDIRNHLPSRDPIYALSPDRTKLFWKTAHRSKLQAFGMFKLGRDLEVTPLYKHVSDLLYEENDDWYGPLNERRRLAWSPDSSGLFVNGYSDVWRLEANGEDSTTAYPTDSSVHYMMPLDNNSLYVLDDGGEIAVMDFSSRAKPSYQKLSVDQFGVLDVAISHDRKKLAVLEEIDISPSWLEVQLQRFGLGQADMAHVIRLSIVDPKTLTSRTVMTSDAESGGFGCYDTKWTPGDKAVSFQSDLGLHVIPIGR